MSQSIQCPRCGLTMPVIRELAGQQVACPDCQHNFTMVSLTSQGLSATPATYSAQLPSNRYRRQSPNNSTKWFVPVFTAVGILFALGLGMLVLQSENQGVIAEKPGPNTEPRTRTANRNSAAIDKQRDELRRWETELEQREATLRTREESRPRESTVTTSTAPSATIGDSKQVDKSPATANIAARFGNSAVAPDVGPRPTTNSDGSLECVKDYLNNTLDDPSGLQFVKWSGTTIIEYPQYSIRPGQRYWAVRVIFRAKNAIGAMRLLTCVFLIKNNEVIEGFDMDSGDVGVRYAIHKWLPLGTFPGEGPLRDTEFARQTDEVQDAFSDFLNPAKSLESFKSGNRKK